MLLFLRRALLMIGLLAFGGLLVAGAHLSWARFDGPPPASLYTSNYLQTLLDESDPGFGVGELSQRLRIAPTADNARNLAALAAEEGDREHMVFAARAWVEIERRSPEAHLLLASTLLGDPDPTRPELREAAAHARRAVQLAPDDPRAWTGMGRALIALEQPANARRALERALRLDPGFEPARRALEAVERS